MDPRLIEAGKRVRAVFGDIRRGTPGTMRLCPWCKAEIAPHDEFCTLGLPDPCGCPTTCDDPHCVDRERNLRGE